MVLFSRGPAGYPGAEGYAAKGQGSVRRWRTTREQASILQRVADMMGEDVYKVMADLHSGAPEDADTLYRAFTQRLEKAAASDPNAAKMLEALAKDQSLNKLTGNKLKDLAGIFLGKDGAAFDADLYKGQLFHLLTEGTEKWAVDWFGIKPANFAVRTGNLVKRAQGLLLLGINPSYLVNNALNNLVTLGWDGLLGMNGVRSGRSWLKDMGLNPIRLRAGANAAEIGAADDVSITGLGKQIRRASRAGDIIQSMDDFARGADRFAIFANLSQHMERWSSEMAMTNAMRQIWDQIWVEGKGISKMPPDLELALDAMEKGLSKRVKNAIAKGKNRQQIEKLIFRDLGAPDLHEALTPAEKELLGHFPGLIDDMNTGLKASGNSEDVRRIFTDARKRVQDGINEQIQRNAKRITQEAANKVVIEGGQGILDVFDTHMQERHDFWLLHFEKMDAAAAEADKASGVVRAAIWARATAEADRDWKAFENVEGAKWLGIFEGLGASKDDPVYIDALENLTGIHTAWQAYYRQRASMMDAFYELSYGTKSNARRLELLRMIPGAIEEEQTVTSQKLWQLVNEELNRGYAETSLLEDEFQSLLDEGFAEQYAAQFPNNAGARAEALAWREAVQNVRQRMVATMVLYRTGDMPPAEIEHWVALVPPEIRQQVLDLTVGMPPYGVNRERRSEISKKFYAEIYTPYIREMLDASNNNAPGKPKPQGPQPPVAPRPAPASPEPAMVADPATTQRDNIPPVSPSPRTPPQPVASPGEAAQVPVMITQQMKRQLADQGFTPEQIKDMTPQQAWDNINAAGEAAQPLNLPSVPRIWKRSRRTAHPG